MSYSKTTWQNGVTPINQTNLNKIENELESLDNNKLNKSGDTITGTLIMDNQPIKFNQNGNIFWKEDNYGDKFRIIPNFTGTGSDNKLLIQSTTGGEGTDPDNWTDLAVIHADTGKIDLASDTGWLNLPMVSPATSGNPSFSGFDAQYRKINNIVYLRGLIVFNQTGSWGLYVAQLPEGFRPAHESTQVGRSYNTYHHSNFSILPNGSIIFLENTSGGADQSTGMFIDCSFVAD